MRILCLVAALAFLSFLSSTTAHAQSSIEQVVDEAIAAIKSGDADRLATHFNGSIELTLFGKREVYQAQQAKFVMKDFFDSNPPSSFEVKHTGDTGSTTYALGEYRSPGGIFEVNIFVKGDGQPDFKISLLRFDKM